MADVFISYARPDAAAAQMLARALESDGVSVWWDGKLQAQSAWETRIEAELDVAKVVVVLWSTDSVSNNNVKAEARRAKDAERLVQVLLDDSSPPLFFGERQALGLARWDGSKTNHYLAALSAIHLLIAGEALTKEVQRHRSRSAANETIDENDRRFLALSPMDRLSLSLSPMDLRRTERHRVRLEDARQLVRHAGLQGGWFNWLIARTAVATLKRHCREDERWHRTFIRRRYKNELVRELQLAYAIDVFDNRLDDIRSLERELG